MQQYQTLYHRIFNAVTDALRALDRGETEQARAILIRAQQEAEDAFIIAEEEPQA